jgi:hypothetical protein
MSDLASQPETSETPLTLAERRANYESWLKSGRRTAKPAHTTRVDDLPSMVDLRAKAEADSAAQLLSPLPAGAIVRTDDGTGDSKVELTDDLRLNIAQALLPKIEGATADQAERIANLTSTILGPAITRADDVKADENLKNEVLNQGKGGVKSYDDKKADDASPTLATIMDTLGKITGRLDALEGRKDGEHAVTPPEDKERKEIADDDIHSLGSTVGPALGCISSLRPVGEFAGLSSAALAAPTVPSTNGPRTASRAPCSGNVNAGCAGRFAASELAPMKPRSRNTSKILSGERILNSSGRSCPLRTADRRWRSHKKTATYLLKSRS